MAFIFISCPNCSTDFMYHPLTDKVTGTIPNPRIKEKTKAKPKKDYIAVLEKQKVALPIFYLCFLQKSAKSRLEIKVVKNQEKFRLYALSELCSNVTVNDVEVLTIFQLKKFALSLKKIAKDGLYITNRKESLFSLKRLANCFSIGEENTQILFTDPNDDYSLWIFHTDNANVEFINLSLEKMMKNK